MWAAAVVAAVGAATVEGADGGGSTTLDAKVPTAAVHLFEWDWPSIAHECETVLGPKGYDGVQVSPPNEHLAGPQWWTRYQPVSYKLISRSGSEAQFKDMVQRCNAVGVMIIVDAVVNHMALGSNGSGVGVAGSTFGERRYPGVPFGPENFHHRPGVLSSNCIASSSQDFHDVQAMQFCDLVSLPDLDTENPHTLSTINEFLRNLTATGSNVGFRFDAAKSIPAAEFVGIVRSAGSPWQYSEVHSEVEDPAPLQPQAYLEAGHVTEFAYSNQVGDIFKADGQMPRLEHIGEASGLLPSENAVVFMENHDTMQPNCFSCAPINHDDGDKFFLGNVFMLAWPYGYPLVMSSYAYPPGDHDSAPPAYPVTCGSSWHCEHRRPEVANMVAWRRTAGSLPVEGFTQDPSQNGVYFSRGGLAFVALNRRESGAWSAWMRTRLPPGAYCNVIQSDDAASCPYTEVNGSGIAWISVPAISAVALHVGKRFAGPSSQDSDGLFWPWGILTFCLLGASALLLCALGYMREQESRSRKRRGSRTASQTRLAEASMEAKGFLPASAVSPTFSAGAGGYARELQENYIVVPTRAGPQVPDAVRAPLLVPIASG